MTDMQPKKMIILDILDILRKHTDEDHRLSQQQIQNLMKSEYGMKVDRKTVRRNLSKLMEYGFPINTVAATLKKMLSSETAKTAKKQY